MYAIRSYYVIGGQLHAGETPWTVHEPQAPSRVVGEVSAATPAQVHEAAALAQAAFTAWEARQASERATLLESWADALEARRTELLSLCIREAGKTWQDGLDEIREAVDLCRYYAAEARRLLATEQLLPGATGEHQLSSEIPFRLVRVAGPLNQCCIYIQRFSVSYNFV